jgi:hypothetical protein
MKIAHIIKEANVYKKINDPKLKKMIALAVHHDGSFPKQALVKLGKNPSDDSVVKALSDLIDSRLRDSMYGDLSGPGKFDDWLMRLYANNALNWEDLSGEGVDMLGAYNALLKRKILKSTDTDLNQYKTIRQLIDRMQYYSNEIARLKNEERINAAKKNKKEIVLIDNDRYWVSIPLNYGACYFFNNAAGVPARFCTGSSDSQWFDRYATQGAMIDVFDKSKSNDDKFQKWQLHAVTRQIKDAVQDYESRDETFAKINPGLLKQITDAMAQNADLIKNASSETKTLDGSPLVKDGYDVTEEIRKLASAFPLSYNSVAPTSEPSQGTIDA